MGGGSSAKKRGAAFGGENSEDGEGVFSAGHELVFTSAAGQLSFADSVMVDHNQ